MFSEKKRFPWGWIAITVVLGAIGILFIIAAFADDTEPDRDINNSNIIQSENSGQDDSDDENRNDNNSDEPVSKIVTESYYLVKNDNNIVRVYYYDSQGKHIEIEKTNIVYETLSESDQKRLDEGIKLSSREQLNKLLMDYES